MGAYKGNAFAPISPPNFPITKWPRLVRRSYGMRQRYYYDSENSIFRGAMDTIHSGVINK